MYYELRPGPLALMVEKAEAAPGVPHILIIDEINRANLPRVFGELLFLLEYRNKSVRTAYRPDEPFELPTNLFFIGTMNTADRSIAMVDAALRRRFHFIPFMPARGADGRSLLPDWLKSTRRARMGREPGRPGQRAAQGPAARGRTCQVGHSHFMVKKEPGGVDRVLTDARLPRIWEYDIYPFIEDQLYGKPEKLAAFTWDAVRKTYGPGSASAAVAQQEAAESAADGDAEGG